MRMYKEDYLIYSTHIYNYPVEVTCNLLARGTYGVKY